MAPDPRRNDKLCIALGVRPLSSGAVMLMFSIAFVPAFALLAVVPFLTGIGTLLLLGIGIVGGGLLAMIPIRAARKRLAAALKLTTPFPMMPPIEHRGGAGIAPFAGGNPTQFHGLCRDVLAPLHAKYQVQRVRMSGVLDRSA